VALQPVEVGRIAGARYGDDRAQLEQALTRAREAQSHQVEADSLRTLGALSFRQSDYGPARAHWEQALHTYRAIGDRHGASATLNNLGLACACQGDYAQAKAYLEQSLDIGREIDEPRIVGYILSNLGNALAGLGLLTEAADACRQALVLWRELNQPNLATEPLAGLAHISLAREDLYLAQSQAVEILSLLEHGALDHVRDPFRIFWICYRVLRASQDPRAQKILTTAYNLLRERATRIEDEGLRHSYLENVACHQTIADEFGQAA
jgi:tetratricopeptide (TPR) repeat protein